MAPAPGPKGCNDEVPAPRASKLACTCARAVPALKRGRVGANTGVLAPDSIGIIRVSDQLPQLAAAVLPEPIMGLTTKLTTEPNVDGVRLGTSVLATRLRGPSKW